MKPYRSLAGAGLSYCVVLIVFLVNLAAPNVAAGWSKPKHPVVISARLGSTPLGHSGFEHFYNMEYDKAIHDFELDAQQHQDDPFAANHLVTAVLFKELYRIGALDTELYASDNFLSARRFEADPKVRQRIRELTDHAQALSEQRLKANPNDIDALYARGATKATRSLTLGLMDHAWFSGLRNAVGARHDHEHVLEMNPNYTDAKMVIGTDYYVVGSLSWTAKAAASLIGLSGSRPKGIQYLYDAANGGGETSVDAMFALALFLRREQRYGEAIQLVDKLMNAYPHNYLVALEHANLLNAAGRGPEAITAYRKLLVSGQNGLYQDPRLEQAAWGLGEALRGQRDLPNAAQAYESVRNYPRVPPELLDRSTLAAGEMYDLTQQRDRAIGKYKQVIATADDSPCATQARKYLKQPYQLPKK